eukprot:SAG11_NODE_1119_length_5789_cov_56.660808_1_plen_1685_part_00
MMSKKTPKKMAEPAPSPMKEQEQGFWRCNEPEPVPTRIWDNYIKGFRTNPDGNPRDPCAETEGVDKNGEVDENYYCAGYTTNMPMEVVPYIRARDLDRQVKKKTFSQEVRLEDRVNPWMDIDFTVNTQEECAKMASEIQTWAKTEIPKAFPKCPAKDIGISLTCREHPFTDVFDSNQQPYKPEKWKKWKVSLHIVVNGYKCRLGSQPELFEKLGLWKKGGPELRKDSYLIRGTDCVDGGVYKSSQIIRLLNNHKPQINKKICEESEGVPAVWVTINDLARKGYGKNMNNTNRLYMHVVTLDLNRCVDWTPKPPVATPPADDVDICYGELEPKQTFTESMILESKSSSTDTGKGFSAEELVQVMNLLDADIGHNNRINIVNFLKSKCHDIFEDSGKQLWLDMCARYEDPDHKQNPMECEMYWDRLDPTLKEGQREIGYGTVVYHAKKRNPDKLVKLYKDSLLKMTNPGLQATQNRLAKIVSHQLPPLKYCKDSKPSPFFMYNETTGIWFDQTKDEIQQQCVDQLSKLIDDVLKHCYKKVDILKKQLEETDDEASQAKLQKELDKLLCPKSGLIVAWKVKKASVENEWASKIVGHLKGLVTDSRVHEKWNSNTEGKLTWILPFANGIIDLREPYPMQLKPAPVELMIKYTTGYDYVAEWATMDRDKSEIVDFRRHTTKNYSDPDDTDPTQLGTGPGDNGQYDWCLFKDSTSLLGFNAFEEFTMMTGGGANGKSKEVEMKQAMFGKLMGDLKPAYYQTGVKDPNSASSFLKKLQYCRCISSEEPEDDKRPLYGGRIKKICGRNFLEARANFENSDGFIPQWDPLFVANHLPDITGGMEYAIGRRLIVREFVYCFDRSKAAELNMSYREPKWTKVELEAKVRTSEWRQAYLHVLLEHLAKDETKNYILTLQNSKEHPAFPQEWLLSTKNQQRQDPQYRWIEENIVFTHIPEFRDRPRKFWNDKTKKADFTQEEHPLTTTAEGRAVMEKIKLRAPSGKEQYKLDKLFPGTFDCIRLQGNYSGENESVYSKFENWRQQQGQQAQSWKLKGQDELFRKIFVNGAGQTRHKRITTKDDKEPFFTGIMFYDSDEGREAVNDGTGFLLSQQAVVAVDEEGDGKEFDKSFEPPDLYQEKQVSEVVTKSLHETKPVIEALPKKPLPIVKKKDKKRVAKTEEPPQQVWFIAHFKELGYVNADLIQLIFNTPILAEQWVILNDTFIDLLHGMHRQTEMLSLEVEADRKKHYELHEDLYKRTTEDLLAIIDFETVEDLRGVKYRSDCEDKWERQGDFARSIEEGAEDGNPWRPKPKLARIKQLGDYSKWRCFDLDDAFVPAAENKDFFIFFSALFEIEHNLSTPSDICWNDSLFDLHVVYHHSRQQYYVINSGGMTPGGIRASTGAGESHEITISTKMYDDWQVLSEYDFDPENRSIVDKAEHFQKMKKKQPKGMPQVKKESAAEQALDLSSLKEELDRNISATFDDVRPSPLTSIKRYEQQFPDSQDSIDDEEQELYDVFQSFSNMFENEGNVVTYQVFNDQVDIQDEFLAEDFVQDLISFLDDKFGQLLVPDAYEEKYAFSYSQEAFEDNEIIIISLLGSDDTIIKVVNETYTIEDGTLVVKEEQATTVIDDTPTPVIKDEVSPPTSPYQEIFADNLPDNQDAHGEYWRAERRRQEAKSTAPDKKKGGAQKKNVKKK